MAEDQVDRVITKLKVKYASVTKSPAYLSVLHKLLLCVLYFTLVNSAKNDFDCASSMAAEWIFLIDVHLLLVQQKNWKVGFSA